LIRFGLKAAVTVTTKTGAVLYPAEYPPGHEPLLAPDPMQVAAENFRLMQQGLAVKVQADAPPTALLSAVLLATYIALGLLGLYAHYRSVGRRIQQEELQQQAEIQRLLTREAETTKSLRNLMADRENLAAELQQLRTALDAEKTKASRNEDDMLEEMAALERELEQNLARQQGQQEEIETLKEELKRFEKEKRKDDKQKVKAVQAAAKRFSALYKNLTVSERALGGYIDLPEDLKIKAEEIIHQLDQNQELVTVKRKVFGKKNRKTVLEVVFGYKGRLYFMNMGSNVEVMAIGTKNTQGRELEFLDKL
jgi:flagellar motility protein MotE (MotC chaperone)